MLAVDDVVDGFNDLRDVFLAEFLNRLSFWERVCSQLHGIFINVLEVVVHCDVFRRVQISHVGTESGRWGFQEGFGRFGDGFEHLYDSLKNRL